MDSFYSTNYSIVLLRLICGCVVLAFHAVNRAIAIRQYGSSLALPCMHSLLERMNSVVASPCALQGAET